MFIRGFRAKRVLIWTRLKGAAGPRPDEPRDGQEDEIQVTRVPDVPSVSNFSAMRTEHDVSFIVPRPARWSVRLSRGGWRASHLPSLRSYLALSKRNAHTIPWPSLTMMTSSSLNRWYVYVCTVSLSVTDGYCAHLGHVYCGCGGIVLASKRDRRAS